MNGETAATDSHARLVPTARELLEDARERLRRADLDASSREASLLLSRALGLTEAELIARDREPVPAAEVARFTDWLERRLDGEPVAYILGEREFFGRRFHVDRRVLIPRPETEHLVERALALPLPDTARIVDLGTGSGCIAVTIACERPRARLVAVDRFPGALAVARRNTRRHRVASRVRLLAASWGRALDFGGVDLLVSNPPYVGSDEETSLSPEIRDFEPRAALLGGSPEGTAAFADLLGSVRSVRPGTPLLCEIGAGRLGRIEEIAATRGWDIRDVVEDYAGLARIVRLSRN